MASSTSLGSRPSFSQTSAYSSRVRPSATACSTPGTTAVSDTGELRRAREKLEPVLRTMQQVDGVLGVGHQADDVARLVGHAGDVLLRAVGVDPQGVAEDHPD